MQRNAVGWFEIYVDDLERAKAFYETVFQVSLSPLTMPDGSGDIQMFMFPMDGEAAGAAGALCKMKDFGPGVGGTLVYFSAEDCSVEEGRVTGAGGSVVKPKESIGEYGFMSLVKDTEGNIIGIHSLK